MNDLIAKKVLGREPAIPTTYVLDEYANTSSAGSIIAFTNTRRFRPGELGVICSFGAGYSAGSVIVRRLD